MSHCFRSQVNDIVKTMPAVGLSVCREGYRVSGGVLGAGYKPFRRR